ncbi:MULTISPECIES: hypothetical protein [Arthrobacter]|uniref:hypothetical protein n=1 Tax=Arthrobacter TaxID=1663 RepID=UPI001264092C|nr:hypothetical protein [Arthrobacter gandavensis]
MMRTTKKTAIFLSTAGLVAGSAILPSAASAYTTECEPGTVHTTFNHAAVANSQVPAGSVTANNVNGTNNSVTAVVDRTTTLSASVSGSVSFDSIIAPLQAEISAEVSNSATWSAGGTIGPFSVPAGQSYIVTYGFNQVSFSGTQSTCQLNGMAGPVQQFSGTAPAGVYINY